MYRTQQRIQPVTTRIISQIFRRLDAQTVTSFDLAVQDVIQHDVPDLVLFFGLFSKIVSLVASTANQLPRQYTRIGFDNYPLRIT